MAHGGQTEWIIVVLALLLATPTEAQTKVARAPVVLLLRSADDGPAARQEQRFYDELSLVLDDFAIFSQAPDAAGFFAQPLSQQVEAVERMAADDLAVAAVWLEALAGQRVAVHLVAARTGRTLVRTVEARGQRNPQAVMALTVRELLGTAFLFEPAKARETPAVRQVVETVRQDVVSQAAAEAPPPAVPESFPPGFTVGGGPFLSQGLWGQVGPALRVGGRLVGEGGGRTWRAGVALEGSSWPGLTTEAVSLSGWEVAFGVEGGPRWGGERWRAGPTLGVHAVHERLSGWTPSGPQAFSSWHARALVGAAAVWRWSERWLLSLGARLELNQARVQAFQGDGGAVVAQGPWGSLRVELSLAFL